MDEASPAGSPPTPGPSGDERVRVDREQAQNGPVRGGERR
jgi:hypothetical protein